MEIFNTLATSIATLPNSTIFPAVQRRVQRFLYKGELPGSWVDITPNPAQLDSRNSLLDKGTYLIIDSVADTLVLVTGEPQVVSLLGHDDVDSLLFEKVHNITLKLRPPLPTLSLQSRDFVLAQSMKGLISVWASDAWFKDHVVFRH